MFCQCWNSYSLVLGKTANFGVISFLPSNFSFKLLHGNQECKDIFNALLLGNYFSAKGNCPTVPQYESGDINDGKLYNEMQSKTLKKSRLSQIPRIQVLKINCQCDRSGSVTGRAFWYSGGKPIARVLFVCLRQKRLMGCKMVFLS